MKVVNGAAMQFREIVTESHVKVRIPSVRFLQGVARRQIQAKKLRIDAK